MRRPVAPCLNQPINLRSGCVGGRQACLGRQPVGRANAPSPLALNLGAVYKDSKLRTQS